MLARHEDYIHRSPDPQNEILEGLVISGGLSQNDLTWARRMRFAFRRSRRLSAKQISVVQGLCRKVGVGLNREYLEELFGYGS